MTTLVCWCGIDPRGASSLYLVTDSRFSWSNGAQWNFGRKLAIRPQYNEILAFAGDVTLCHSLFLSLPETPLSDDFLHAALMQMSKGYQAKDLQGTAVVLARRIGAGMGSAFSVTSHEYLSNAWQLVVRDLHMLHSDIVCAYGSGSPYAVAEVKRWMNQDVSGRTSRSVFSGFCDALRSGSDPKSGGVPQLAGIFRGEPAQEIGIVWSERLYRAGREVTGDVDPVLRWRNDLFELCDPRIKGTWLIKSRPSGPPAFNKTKGSGSFNPEFWRLSSASREV
jgi:hypothetical protein